MHTQTYIHMMVLMNYYNTIHQQKSNILHAIVINNRQRNIWRSKRLDTSLGKESLWREYLTHCCYLNNLITRESTARLWYFLFLPKKTGRKKLTITQTNIWIEIKPETLAHIQTLWMTECSAFPHHWERLQTQLMETLVT